jgi:hypothetical protein
MYLSLLKLLVQAVFVKSAEEASEERDANVEDLLGLAVLDAVTG